MKNRVLVGTVNLTRSAGRLHRVHRVAIHLSVCAMIGVSLYIDGAKPADMLFLALSVLSEMGSAA